MTTVCPAFPFISKRIEFDTVLMFCVDLVCAMVAV
jgi:hypothetical protein